MKTIQEVLRSGIDYLTAHGCDEARTTMQHLMAHVLHCNRMELYSDHDKPVPEESLAPLRVLLKRRASGEPLQHLLGTTEFFRRDFITDARALIPRPETEELVDFTLKRLPHSQTLRILDMGTGSGIIGITLALELGQRAKDVILADISDKALSLSLENAIKLGAKVSTVKTDLFTGLPVTAEVPVNDEEEDSPLADQGYGLFDAIIANLPYIADEEPLDTEVMHDPHTALFGGPHGWEIIERFLAEARDHLTENGFVALEIGYDQASTVSNIMQVYGYSEIEVLKDMSGIARFPFAYR